MRSDRKPMYKLDESDDETDMMPGKSGTKKQEIEKIVRTDVVCCLYIRNCLLLFMYLAFSIVGFLLFFLWMLFHPIESTTLNFIYKLLLYIWLIIANSFTISLLDFFIP